MALGSTILYIGTILYIIINIVSFPFIAYVTYCLAKAFVKAKKKPNRILFAVNIFFNVVTVSAVFGLLFMACLKLQSIETHIDLHENPLWRRYHGIFVLFYGKQNALMLLVLYLRVYLIFKDSAMQLSTCTFHSFNMAFAVAILIFTSLPIIHSQYTHLSIWIICASSFCVYNVLFMTLLSYLFASKLLASFKNISGSGNKRGRQAVADMMAKTSLLAMFSISMTMTSCILLILRYSVHVESKVVFHFSNWLMSFDIYSNFIFVSLSMKYFDKYYRAIFGRLDVRFKKFIYWCATKGNVDGHHLAQYFEETQKETKGGSSRTRTLSGKGQDGVTSTTISITGAKRKESQDRSMETESVPSTQPQHDNPTGMPVPSSSAIATSDHTELSRSDAATGGAHSIISVSDPVAPSIAIDSQKPLDPDQPYVHQGSTTMDSKEENSVDGTPSTGTNELNMD